MTPTPSSDPSPADRGTRVRAVVVGASSGIGRAVAASLIEAGAEVVVTARRREPLEELVAEAGSGTVVTADLTDAGQCADLMAAAVEALGAIDLVVVATGVSLLRRIAETEDEDWETLFRTNVIGVHTLLRAVTPVLADAGLVAVLSSEDSAQVRDGLGAYAASKAALDTVLAAWRNEWAPRRLTRVVVGATSPTEMSDSFDADLLTEMLDSWIRAGRMQNALMAPEELGDALVGCLLSVLRNPGVGLDTIELRSPSGVLGSPELTKAQLQQTLADR